MMTDLIPMDAPPGSWLLTVTAQDRPGVVAEIAGRMRDLSCSIVVASTEVVVGQVIIMIIACPRGGLVTAEAIEAAFDGLAHVRPQAIHPVPIPARKPRWPQPDSAFHRLRFTVAERAGAFCAITQPIADRDVPLFAFSTWVGDDRWCHGDVVMAVSPEIAPDSLGQDLYKAIKHLGAYKNMSWRHLSALPLPPKRYSVAPERGIAFSIVGFARPGFVRCALDELAAQGVSVVGSAMAILDAFTGLLLVVDGKDRDPEGLRAALAQALDEFDASMEEPFQSQVRSWWIDPVAEPRWPENVTHTVRCEAVETPGILAEVAGFLSSHEINIVRTRAGIDVEPEEDVKSNCVIDLAVALSSDMQQEFVQAALDGMKASQGWHRAEIQKAQPDPDDVRLSRDPASAVRARDWVARLENWEPVEVDTDPVKLLRALRDT
jgi:predicted amino acid-binding ACT domain protein